MTKTLNQIIIFFLHQNQNIFFNNIENQNTMTDVAHTNDTAVTQICSLIKPTNKKIYVKLNIIRRVASYVCNSTMVKFDSLI
jgi:hypothetical protein